MQEYLMSCSKKPTIKQGVFTSDLLLNGTSAAPYILGSLNIKSVDIPLLDSTVRDINIDFNDDFIYLNSKAVVLTNDILLDAKIVNKPVQPYVVEDVKVQMDALNLNVISAAIDDFDADNTRTNQGTAPQVLPPDMLIIKNAQINADNVLIKKTVLFASDLFIQLMYKMKVFYLFVFMSLGTLNDVRFPCSMLCS